MGTCFFKEVKPLKTLLISTLSAAVWLTEKRKSPKAVAVVDVEVVDDVVLLVDCSVVDVDSMVVVMDVVGMEVVLLDKDDEDVERVVTGAAVVVGMVSVKELRGADDVVVGCCVTAVEVEEIG